MVYLQRFKWWAIECVASGVVLASFLSYRYHLPETTGWTSVDSLMFSVPSISVLLSVGAMVASVLERSDPATCRLESVLVWAETILWAVSTVAVTVGPFLTRDLAELDNFIVLQPNLYFFSMLALIIAMVIMASWFNQYIHGDDEKSVATQWIMLGSISFLAMITGIAFRESLDGQVQVMSLPNGTMYNSTVTLPACQTDNFSCDRVTFSIVLSAVSAVVACLMTPFKGITYKCQADVSLVLFVAWLFGIGYLTFDTGPANRWNSLYFASFINLFLCLDILIQSTAGSEVNINPEMATYMRRSSKIDREAIFEAAYNQLGRIYHEPHESLNRTASYANLFEEVKYDADDEEIEELPAQDRQSYVDQEYLANSVQRLELWCILIIESAVNVASLVRNVSEAGSRTHAEKSVLILPCLSIVVGLVGFSTCMRKRKRARVIQAVSIALVTIIWIAAVTFLAYVAGPVILGYNDGFDTEIDRDPNLFFSTWVSVILCLLMVTNVFRASVVTQDWVLLATFSFALMASSVIYFRSDQYAISEDGTQVLLPPCSNKTSIKETTCKKATLGFYLGLWSGIISLLMIPMYRFGPILHFVVSMPLLILWGVAVAFITFNAKIGVAAGILYFSCWIAAFTSIDLTTMNFLRIVRNRKQRKERVAAESAAAIHASAVPREESAAAAGSNHISTETAYGDMTIVPLQDEDEQQANAGREKAQMKRVSFMHVVRAQISTADEDDDDDVRNTCLNLGYGESR